MDTTVADSLLGALIDGRYRVRARLARGGMATVYTAFDERLERTVALKIIHRARADEVRFLDRFTDEAKAIARLTHPNVVAVYDQGTYDGLPYLVMEFVRGQTLRELLAERRRLTPVEALAILEQMLAAIAAAHRAGLVHRDVKPENVLVGEAPGHDLLDSVVKVGDFGLARAVEEASTDTAATGGQLLATVAYVAPELVSDGHADPRTDVYSAGVVLFEMLTGRVPYEAERPVEVAWQHVDQDVPAPSRYVPGLPPALDELVVRATRRDPGARPTDAGAMLAEVQDVRDDLDSAGRPAGDHTTATLPRYDSDATLLVPGLAADRPAWARLPAPRTQTRAESHPETRTRAQTRAMTRSLAAPRAGTPTRRQPGGLHRLKAAALAHPQARVGLAVALVVLGLLVAAGGWWFGVGRYTTAPSLQGLQKAQAVAFARQGGFEIHFANGRFDEKVPRDAVLLQDPEVGQRIVSGGRITVVLSLGPERYPMPDEAGKDLAAAQADLQELRLQVAVNQVYDDLVPNGTVTGSDPAAQTTIKPGTRVTLNVSKGRAPVTVPPVVGISLGDAQNQLTALGLQVAVKQQDSDKPKDQVVSQDVADGTGVDKGTTVTLTVSNGPKAVVVQDVGGRDAAEAQQILTQQGLQVQVIGSGKVRFQNPGANAQVPPGTTVVIWCFP